MIGLQTILTEERASSCIQVFASHEEALSHICDHVLTRPEAHYWSLLIRTYQSIVDRTNDQDLDRIADAFWRGDRQNDAQILYDGYAYEISLAMCVATTQQWLWQETRLGKTRHFGVGTSGVKVVWRNQVVVSAMLEPFAAPRPRQSISYYDRKGNSRPRRATWPERYGFLPTANEESYYELFVISFSSVRQKIHRAWKEGRTNGYAMNTDEVPIPSRDEWRSISEDAVSRLAGLGLDSFFTTTAHFARIILCCHVT